MSLLQNAFFFSSLAVQFDYQSECHCSKTGELAPLKSGEFDYQSECHCSKTRSLSPCRPWLFDYQSECHCSKTDMNLDRMDDGVKIIFYLENNRTGVSIKHIASAADNDEVIASESARYILNGNIEEKHDSYDGEFLFVPVREV